MANKVVRFRVVHAEHNGFLHNFDVRWFNEYQDDPSCWTTDKAEAKKYTQVQIDKMHSLLVGFQGQYTLEAG